MLDQVFPPSVDRTTTMLALYTTSGFLGSTRGTGRSPPPIRIAGRGSLVAVCQLSPASSERYTPRPAPEPYSPFSVVATVAYSRLGWLAAIATLICVRLLGRPFFNACQLFPPSVDLKRPPPVP